MLHYGNAPAHSTHFTREFLTKHNISLVLHARMHTFFLLDSEPNDFSLLITFKSTPPPKRFHEVPQIVQSAIQELNNNLKEQYQKCFNKQQESRRGANNFRTVSICPGSCRRENK
jgi:hypothetical protein